ncbi:hypothetical protein, conserved, partial [Eimeria acervulina]
MASKMKLQRRRLSWGALRRVMLLLGVSLLCSFVLTPLAAYSGDFSVSPGGTEPDQVSSYSRAVGDVGADIGSDGGMSVASVTSGEEVAVEDVAAAEEAAAAAAEEEAGAEDDQPTLKTPSSSPRRSKLPKSAFAVSVLTASIGAAVFASLLLRREIQKQEQEVVKLQNLQPQMERLADLVGSDKAVQLGTKYKELISSLSECMDRISAERNPVQLRALWRQLEEGVEAAVQTVGDLQREADRVSVSFEELPVLDTEPWIALQPAFSTLGVRDFTEGILGLQKFAKDLHASSAQRAGARREAIRSLPAVTSIEDSWVVQQLIEEMLHLQTDFDEAEQCVELWESALGLAESAVRDKVVNTTAVSVQQLKCEIDLLSSFCFLVKEAMDNASPKTRASLSKLLDSKKQMSRKFEELVAVQAEMAYVEDVADVLMLEAKASAASSFIRKTAEHMMMQLKAVEHLLGPCETGKQQAVQFLQQKGSEAVQAIERARKELEAGTRRMQADFTELVAGLPASVDDILGERIAVGLMDEVAELLLLTENVQSASKTELEALLRSKSQRTANRFARDIFYGLSKATQSLGSFSVLKHRFALYRTVEAETVMSADAAFAARQFFFAPQERELVQQKLSLFGQQAKRARESERIADFVKIAADLHGVAHQLQHHLLDARYLKENVAGEAASAAADALAAAAAAAKSAGSTQTADDTDAAADDKAADDVDVVAAIDAAEAAEAAAAAAAEIAAAAEVAAAADAAAAAAASQETQDDDETAPPQLQEAEANEEEEEE